MYRLAFLACLYVLTASQSSGATPAVLDTSWAEAMVNTKSALQAAQPAERARPFRSPTLRGGDAPVRVELDITGLDAMTLEATDGGDNYNYDQAIWAEPELVREDGTRVRLTSLRPTSVSVGWGSLLTDHNHQDKPLRIREREFGFGFWAHAPSKLVFPLDGAYVEFTAWAGIDAAASDNGSVVFVAGPADDQFERAWMALSEAFPEQCARFEQALGQGRQARWFTTGRGVTMLRRATHEILDELGDYAPELRQPFEALDAAGRDADEKAWLELLDGVVRAREALAHYNRQLERLDLTALRLAIEDLGRTFPGLYDSARYLTQLEALTHDLDALRTGSGGSPGDIGRVEAALVLRREALMANPLLDFDELLLVRRGESTPQLGLPANWQGNCSLPAGDYKNDIAALSPVSPEGEIRSIYRPLAARFVGDVDLHFGAERMLFSMPDANGRYQIWEVGVDGTGLRQVTPGDEPDVDNYDACYLPDGRIIYGSTACYVGIPCVFGGSAVANLHIMNADGTGSRQLCVDQDHNWCPTMLNNGRVLFLRWEYADLPHSNTRILFHMNPDGTNQAEYMHSNSYWPNGVFYARAVPNHPTKLVGIVTGHHGVRRMGELVVFDPAEGRRENAGALQRIPGRGEPVEPIIRDQLVDDSWPKFLHPYPLSDKYFIVSCKPSPDARWGIYLVDVFDNMLLLHEAPGSALLEPIPLRATPRPPVIPDRVDTTRDDAVVYLANVYDGPGLAGIPGDAVKALRVFTYTFSHRGMGGLLGTVGMDGPWDIKRVLGTVPVEPDGSALFRVPAYTPVSVQPLDDEGKALQLMRSWFTAMPGEVLSCVGCHEQQSMTPPARDTLAARRAPSVIAPWYGETRGFSFAREVQPVLDRNCVSCHQGDATPNLRGDIAIKNWKSDISGHASPQHGGKFSLAYAELHRYVRRPGIESDNHLLTPMDFHADSTELMQVLNKGHYDVDLSDEEWDRLVTWVDLNAPFHGAWSEIVGADTATRVAERRRELRRKYTGMDEDLEWLPPMPEPVAPVAQRTPERAAPVDLPVVQDVALKAKQAAEFTGARRTLDLGGGITLDLVLLPAGEFLMGSPHGHPDEQPPHRVTVGAPYWMGVTEISNAQYARFDPTHDSRVESKHGYQFGIHGYPLNQPEQPVVRVSWEEAAAFCDWLSGKTGETFRLPSEAEWEYACRAGTATAFSFGNADVDYTQHANLGDQQLARFASNPYTLDQALPNPGKYDDWVPRDDNFDDGGFVATPVGAYSANPWGLHDMHGNVWEWTRSAYRPYPDYGDDDRNGSSTLDDRVVRGGSWYDRPHRATSSYRLAYKPWQPVFNVGFRIICTVDPAQVASAHTRPDP